MNLLVGLLIFLGLFNPFLSVTPAPGENAYYDQFPVYEGDMADLEIAADDEENPLDNDVAGTTANKLSPEYKLLVYNQPLTREDYYWGKHINATAGGNEISRMRVLKPGDKISLIGSGYITLGRNKGYVAPGRGYYYGSGLCWSVSTLGGMMDQANAKFKKKYGINLFIYQGGWRRGHSHRYSTYMTSNNGWGYTVAKIGGRGSPDYSFQVNPQINNIPSLRGVHILLRVSGVGGMKGAYKGQGMVAALYSDKKMF